MKKLNYSVWYSIITDIDHEGNYLYLMDEQGEGSYCFDTLNEAKEELREVRQEYPLAFIVKETREEIE
jgi:hypothetical protein